MRPLLYTIAAAMWATAAAAPAGTPTSSALLTAEDAVREALMANRDLQAARLAIDVARGGLLQAGRLENPEFALDLADDFAFHAEGERSLSAGFAQRFPVTARLAREKEVARQDVGIAEAEVRDFARRLVAEVQSAFFTVRALDEQRGVHRELIESVRAVEETTARRLAAAEASPAEVSLLRIERLRLEQDERRLLSEREVALARLVRLLGRETPTVLTPWGDLDPGRLELELGPRDLPDRPDLNAALVSIDRAEADRALAHTEIWEDWTVGLGVERERSHFDPPLGTVRDTFLSLGVTVPVPLWNRRQGRIAAAEAELRRSRRSRDGLMLRIAEEIRAAEVRVRTLRSRANAYAEKILPEATHAQELYERGYRQGLVGVAELLQAQRQYNESRAFYLQLLGALRQAAIDLEAAQGSNRHMRDLLRPGDNTP